MSNITDNIAINKDESAKLLNIFSYLDKSWILQPIVSTILLAILLTNQQNCWSTIMSAIVLNNKQYGGGGLAELFRRNIVPAFLTFCKWIFIWIFGLYIWIYNQVGSQIPGGQFNTGWFFRHPAGPRVCGPARQFAGKPASARLFALTGHG